MNNCIIGENTFQLLSIHTLMKIIFAEPTDGQV